jgi:hypothetical protein
MAMALLRQVRLLAVIWRSGSQIQSFYRGRIALLRKMTEDIVKALWGVSTVQCLSGVGDLGEGHEPALPSGSGE